MLADGKISADEADTLLQAIEESERAAAETATESAQQVDRSGDGLSSLGSAIEYAVKEALGALDETFRSLETKLGDRTRQEQLKRRVEERIRRSTERALERALQAEERAVRAAERAAQRLAERAERIAQREAGASPFGKRSITKVGVHIDKVSVAQSCHLAMAAQVGDRLVLENRVGDIAIEYYDGDQIEVEARKTAWGSDEADANERAALTEIRLVRSGADVTVEIDRPSYSVVGFLQLKDTRIDFTVRVPRQTHLQAFTKVGQITVKGDAEIPAWDLATHVGDIDMTVAEGAGFTYSVGTKLGRVDVALGEHRAANSQPGGQSGWSEPMVDGRFGDGRGRIKAKVSTGDIRLHH